ncbi:MAG: sialate O-acetylesterase [Verrucomicrobiae bacterium]
MKIRLRCLLALFCLAAIPAWADVVLPRLISDHMVLQRSARTSIWGKADPGEPVVVTIDAVSAKTVAGEDGKWAVELDLSASKPGPFELVVQGRNRLAVADVVVGEVWVAAGQSNMEFKMEKTIEAGQELPASANPLLRQFSNDKWEVAAPETTGRFTAVGYYFGKCLQKELNLPIGLINVTVGGTPVEGWISAEAIASVPELKEGGERIKKDYDEYAANKAAYVTQFGQWLKENLREDKPEPDPVAYAGAGHSGEGWTKVIFPGNFQGAGLPATGAVWLRREIVIPAADAHKPYTFSWGEVQGFESVYWNGKLVQRYTHADLKGRNEYRTYKIPAEQVNEGVNVVAVRVYAPLCLFKKTDRLGESLKGEWLAKAEYALPDLAEQAVAIAPVAPLARPSGVELPGSLFNVRIAPITPGTIRGVIWYQGEFNSRRAWQYRISFPLLINDWRAHWKLGDFPFYFCQLPVWHPRGGEPGSTASSWAVLRESQAKALALPHTGMAVLIDTGEAGDLHPPDKRQAGARLAALALANDYGRKIPHKSPLYDSMEIEESRIRIHLKHTDDGLEARPVPETHVVNSLAGETAPLVRNSPKSELEGFAICGEDRKWVWADAKIDGDTVLVWSDQVPTPVAVRYAWAMNPTCNLYSKSGFPTGPFRTDGFPLITQDIKYPQ